MGRLPRSGNELMRIATRGPWSMSASRENIPTLGGLLVQPTRTRALTDQCTSSPTIDHYSHLTRTIMSNISSSSTSRSNLDAIFHGALRAYKKKTGNDITSHPLATELQSCDSLDAILAVLRNQIPTPDQSQNGDETFAKYIIPTINVLYTLSDTLGEGVGLVIITISSL